MDDSGHFVTQAALEEKWKTKALSGLLVTFSMHNGDSKQQLCFSWKNLKYWWNLI